MLSHHNLAWTANVAIQITTINSERLLALVPAALAHRRADVHAAHPDHHGRARLLRRVDRGRARQPQRGAAPPFSLACRASGRSSTPASPRSSSDATGLKAKLVKWAHERRLGGEQERPRHQGVPVQPRQQADLQQAQARHRYGQRARLRLWRCAHRSRDARVLRGARYRRPRGLRPVRGHRPDELQHPGKLPLWQRGPRPPRRRSEDRRRRRDHGQGPERLPRLLQGPGGHRVDAHRRLAPLR